MDACFPVMITNGTTTGPNHIPRVDNSEDDLRPSYDINSATNSKGEIRRLYSPGLDGSTVLCCEIRDECNRRYLVGVPFVSGMGEMTLKHGHFFGIGGAAPREQQTCMVTAVDIADRIMYCA